MLELLQSNTIVQIIAIVMAVFGLAQAIARITPTPKDDEVLGKIGKFLNFLLSKTNEK
jgi:hypothetical protein